MLHLPAYLIKEQVAMFRMADIYDIFDPSSGEHLAVAQEEIPLLAQMLRLVVQKQWLPTTVSVYPVGEDEALFSIRRKPGFLRQTVSVRNSAGEEVGYFRSKIFTAGGGFDVFDTNDQLLAEVRGDWKGWNFMFRGADGQELGVVTKKWAGLAKEMFTSADQYVVAIHEQVAQRAGVNLLLLAAGLSIDMIYKSGR